MTDPLINLLGSISKDSQGHTTRELAQATGLSIGCISAKIRKLFDEGKIEVGCRHEKNIRGMLCPTPTYRLKESV